MKGHLAAYLMSLIPQVGLSQQEFEGALRWIENNYDQWYAGLQASQQREEVFELLKRNADNFVAILSYCDICYEYGDRNRINTLVNHQMFREGSSIVTTYFDLRDNFKKVQGMDELMAWTLYTKEIARQYKVQANNSDEDVFDSLRSLLSLKDAGIITEQEFNQKKAELLNKIK